MEDPSGSGGWRFAQCFGDKGEVEDITEGMRCVHYALDHHTNLSGRDRSRHHIDRRV